MPDPGVSLVVLDVCDGYRIRTKRLGCHQCYQTYKEVQLSPNCRPSGSPSLRHPLQACACCAHCQLSILRLLGGAPMGPAPRMATLFPGQTSPLLQACTPTERGSHMAPSSKLTLGGRTKQKSAGWSTNCMTTRWTSLLGRLLVYFEAPNRSTYQKQTLPGKFSILPIPLERSAAHTASIYRRVFHSVTSACCS